ncbi:MAG: UMP kinase [Caldisphaera sp.]
MESIIIKISGSLIYPPNPNYFNKIRENIIKLIDDYRFGIVVGGGPLARNYINNLRSLNISESILDILGIESAKLNALALSTALNPYAIPKVPNNITEAIEMFSKGLIPVLGGLQPGHSTNAVSIILAESLNSKTVINMLNGVDGIYTKKPNEPDSKKLVKVTYNDMESIIKNIDQLAGGYELLDHVAFELIKRSKIKVIFVDGKDPDVIYKIIKLKEKIGSELTPE